jgi:hypothetical protein
LPPIFRRLGAPSAIVEVNASQSHEADEFLTMFKDKGQTIQDAKKRLAEMN